MEAQQEMWEASGKKGCSICGGLGHKAGNCNKLQVRVVGYFTGSEQATACH